MLHPLLIVVTGLCVQGIGRCGHTPEHEHLALCGVSYTNERVFACKVNHFLKNINIRPKQHLLSKCFKLCGHFLSILLVITFDF